MPATTAKGAATRARIVETAADLVLERGVGGTSLDDIRAGTGTSKSQLFHYFPAGKAELVESIAAFQSERVLDAQRPHQDELDSFESWERWRDAVLAHYGAQRHLACPISALTMESGVDASAHMRRWQGYIEAGVARMGIDDDRTALAIFAALQGGLLLMRAEQSLKPLEAALDGALVILRAAAPSR
jgi:AcrR family transcriptional regulator